MSYYFHKKRTWKQCNDPKILEIYNEVYEEAKRLYPDYFEADLNFYIDNSTKHLGRCEGRYDRTTIYSGYGFKNHFEFLRWDSATILLSKYVTNYTDVRKILVHEFGHFVTPSENHSSCWERRANKIGAKWNITCQRLADKEEVKNFNENIGKKQLKRYSVICSGCGQIVYRQKMCDIIKNPSRWKCGGCGSKFKPI